MFALVFIIGVVSQSNLFSVTIGKKDSDGVVENISMKLSAYDWGVEYLNIDTKNATVADFLFECAEHYDFSVKKEYWDGYDSFFIEAINDIENGQDAMYWQYYVNDKFADVGCSNYFLNDSDVVEWIFEPPRW